MAAIRELQRSIAAAGAEVAHLPRVGGVALTATQRAASSSLSMGRPRSSAHKRGLCRRYFPRLGRQKQSPQFSCHLHSGLPSQIAIGLPMSPQQQHAPPAMSPAQYSAGGSYGHHPSQQPPHWHQQQPLHHQQPHDGQLGYPSHLMSPTSYSYPQGSGAPPPQGSQSDGQQLGGSAAAAAQHGRCRLSRRHPRCCARDDRISSAVLKRATHDAWCKCAAADYALGLLQGVWRGAYVHVGIPQPSSAS
ncbi:hypothetical protein GGX14DRAFT_603440 [Mycena pura]|uniref:Uncharacterized protein n=1 Tax=Mycena pura TaxID=153505 RepID=A0AAD6UN02_9AGAR|nr:hypothetical protein GGX14DRAFT_603440 [Mycena pura]